VDPHAGNGFVVSDLGGNLKIYDVRVDPMDQKWVCQVPQAHHGAVYDVRWSPMVPYWLASAGEDGVVKVWDLRNTKKAMLDLQGHSGSVRR